MLGRQIERRGKGLEREDKSTMDIDSIRYRNSNEYKHN